MANASIVRRPITEPALRVLFGLESGLVLGGADAFLLGLDWRRFVVAVLLTSLLHWSLSPLAMLSVRAPLSAGFVASMCGAGVAAVWWAVLSPPYPFWVMLSVGAGVALVSLAPVVHEATVADQDPAPDAPVGSVAKRIASWTGGPTRSGARKVKADTENIDHVASV